MRTILRACLVPLLVAALASPALAAWPHEPNNGNVALCTAANNQSDPTIVSDGAGGAIVTWHDVRSGTNFDIYAQRISASGVAQWTANGVAVCTAANAQSYPTIVSDGAGGAIVTWHDSRSSTNSDIYAQRISASGVAQWTANGVALCTAAGDQYYPTIVSDGAGGAIVTWYDLRSSSNPDVYAQRISASGVTQWTANGAAVCTAANDQAHPGIASDGAGGAIVTWSDYRSGANYDIYVQRISAGGVAQWTANGVALCTAADDQYYPKIVSDGAGGAIVTWQDFRSGTNYDIYAQRISASGVAQWTANGVAVCTAADDQYYPTIVSDGAGGAIVTWQDYRGGTNYDIYAQRISASGVAQWAANGAALCTAANAQSAPMIVSDGAGGAIVTWQDFRSGTNYDIYAQRISVSGVAQWTANGVALSTAPNTQDASQLVGDGAGGAIVAWGDYRSGTNYDIYAQRVERYGQLGNPEPVILSVSDVRNDQGGLVKVVWSSSYLDADPTYGIAEYRVFRSVPGPFAAAAALRRGVTGESDVAVREGRLLVRPMGAQVTSWEYVGSHAAETFAQYSRVVATTADSVGGSNPRTYFMVEARASSSISADRWYSVPDSGYSVDNLPPVAPAPFTGQYAAGTTSLHWNRNTEGDLAGYRLYRGSGTGFVPGPANLIAAPADTGYVDTAGGPYVYKLTAVDAHGNESPVATLVPSGTTEVAGGPAATFHLAPVAPNPGTRAAGATLRFGLGRAGVVRLEVLDTAGRRVRTLVSGELPAGEHAVRWDGRLAGGQQAAAGLYFVRLAAEGRSAEQRLVLIE
jgi:hypothetical protein